MFRRNYCHVESGISKIFYSAALENEQKKRKAKNEKLFQEFSSGCEKLTNIKNIKLLENVKGSEKDNDFNNCASLSFSIISKDLDLKIRH